MSTPAWRFGVWKVNREASRYHTIDLSGLVASGSVLSNPVVRAEKLSETLVGSTYVPSWSDESSTFLEAGGQTVTDNILRIEKAAMAASSRVGVEVWRVVAVMDRDDGAVVVVEIPILLID